MQNELEPCPFCGGNNIMVSNWGLWRCWCMDCLAKSADEIRKKDAIEAWNRRANESTV